MNNIEQLTEHVPGVLIEKDDLGEPASLSLFNCLAHTLACRELERRGERAPYWLCTARHFREAARLKALEWFNQEERTRHGLSEIMHIAEAECFLGGAVPALFLDIWRHREEAARESRARGNVTAHFVTPFSLVL